MAQTKEPQRHAGAAGTPRWYWVKAAYKAVHIGECRRRHLWERAVFLMGAPGEPGTFGAVELRRRAERIARSKECEYVGARGGVVRWTYQGIEEIQCLTDAVIEDGTEVYWEFYERVDEKLAG